MTTTPSEQEDAPPPPFDPAALDRLKRFGGAKLLGEMIALFLAAAPERLAAARAATDDGNAADAELALHSLKSSAAQLGAMRMQRLAEQGEKLAKAGTLMIVDLLIQDLEDEFTRVREWLGRAQQGEVV